MTKTRLQGKSDKATEWLVVGKEELSGAGVSLYLWFLLHAKETVTLCLPCCRPSGLRSMSLLPQWFPWKPPASTCSSRCAQSTRPGPTSPTPSPVLRPALVPARLSSPRPTCPDGPRAPATDPLWDPCCSAEEGATWLRGDCDPPTQTAGEDSAPGPTGGSGRRGQSRVGVWPRWAHWAVPLQSGCPPRIPFRFLSFLPFVLQENGSSSQQMDDLFDILIQSGGKAQLPSLSLPPPLSLSHLQPLVEC